MKKSLLITALFVIVLLLSIGGSVLAALDTAVPGAVFWRGGATEKEGVDLKAVPTGSYKSVDNVAACRQIVVNPQLDVKELGPDRGTAEPWSFLKEIVYYTKDSNQAYDGYSLILPDGDEDDPSPTTDILNQTVTFDKKLDSVTIAYQRAMIDSNPTDKIYGELWRLTAEGDVDLENPDMYRVIRWPVTDSEKAWAQEVVELDKVHLEELSGQEIAFLLRTETDGGGASAADEEWVLLDDITITTCLDSSLHYLPFVRSN